jgi:hypothetical protein
MTERFFQTDYAVQLYLPRGNEPVASCSGGSPIVQFPTQTARQ